MKENLQTLLQSLRDEKKRLEDEKSELARQNITLNRSRTTMARTCLARLLPDLEMATINALLYQVPDFQVPTVSGWLGFGKKVAPDVTLDSLRMKLGAHLDNTRSAVPAIWKDEVLSIDASIRDLQANLIKSNAERIADIGIRITALEKLLRVDVAKMDPQVRTRLEQAVASQVQTARQSSRPYSNFRRTPPMDTSYPTYVQVNSNSGPSLLDIWLWYQVLTPNSECSREVHRIESGGGAFAGGGASGSRDDNSDAARTVSTQPSLTSDFVPLAIQPDAVNQTEEGQLAFQAELGSQNFS